MEGGDGQPWLDEQIRARHASKRAFRIRLSTILFFCGRKKLLILKEPENIWTCNLLPTDPQRPLLLGPGNKRFTRRTTPSPVGGGVLSPQVLTKTEERLCSPS